MSEQATRTVRSRNEVAGERARASYKLGIALTDGDKFTETHDRAVIEALDWIVRGVAGMPGQGPATGDFTAATESAIRRERRRARSEEHEHRGTFDAVRFHALAVTFGWYLLDPSAEMPA